MADEKISQFPVKTTIDTTDLIAVVDNQVIPGVTKQAVYSIVLGQMMVMAIALG